MKRSVFLDRDGVIAPAIVCDGRSYPLGTVAELEILPGIAVALEGLHVGGYFDVVVTDHPDVATGKQCLEVIEGMHRRRQAMLSIDAIKFCYHADADGCACRKLRPGMLLQAAAELEIDRAGSSMVGDRWRGMGVMHSVGCQAYLFDYGYAERRPDQQFRKVESSAQATEFVLQSP